VDEMFKILSMFSSFVMAKSISSDNKTPLSLTAFIKDPPAKKQSILFSNKLF
jgi:hypothetical protein